MVVAIFVACVFPVFTDAADGPPLPGSIPMAFLPQSERAARSAQQIERFIEARVQNETAGESIWGEAPSSVDRIRENRRRLLELMGSPFGETVHGEIRFSSGLLEPDPLLVSDTFSIRRVSWSVADDVELEGLILVPAGEPKAIVVCIPDPDQSPEALAGLDRSLPEQSQLARVLAANGCVVMVPSLVSRSRDWSGFGLEALGREMSHRAWLNAKARPLGGHIVGMEVDAIRAAFSGMKANPEWRELPVGVAGIGEGATLALIVAAVDERIDSTLNSGGFGTRESVAGGNAEQLFFGRLVGFDDVQLTRLIAPRQLVIEFSEFSDLSRKSRLPPFHEVEREIERAREWFAGSDVTPDFIALAAGNEGMPVEPGSRRALRLFLDGLGVSADSIDYDGAELPEIDLAIENSGRDRSAVRSWEQLLDREAERLSRIRTDLRAEAFSRTNVDQWATDGSSHLRSSLRKVVGGETLSSEELVVRARLAEANDSWQRHEVAFDLAEGAEVWGVLLVPQDADENAPLPAVVCLSDAGDLPDDLIDSVSGRGRYRGFAAQLAERGFVVFVPHVVAPDGERREEFESRLNAVGWSLSALAVEQQRRVLEWMETLPFVDAGRIGVYGFGVGGRIAMEAAAMLDGLAACVVSGAFRGTDIHSGFMPETHFGQWRLFDDAGLVAMIAPRPFMVERGHFDPHADDEWVAHEFAKVRRIYASLGVPDRARIEFFPGPHTINAEGTFAFLDRFLKPD